MDKEKEKLLKEYVKAWFEMEEISSELLRERKSSAEIREKTLMKYVIKKIELRKLEKQLYGEPGE